MKNFLLNLYYNWLFFLYGWITTGWLFFHYSKWWFVFPLIVWAMLSIIHVVKCFAPLRHITWPLHRKYFTNRIEGICKKGSGVLIGFPLLLWVEFEGKKSYIEGGFFGFNTALQAHMDKIKSGLEKWVDTLKPKATQE